MLMRLLGKRGTCCDDFMKGRALGVEAGVRRSRQEEDVSSLHQGDRGGGARRGWLVEAQQKPRTDVVDVRSGGA